MMTLLAVLMVFDVMTWIGKRIALGKKDITSRKLVVGVMAKVFVLSLLLLLAWAFKITMLGNNIAISLVVWMFIAGELYSSIQNIYTIKTGKIVSEYDAVATILGWLLVFVRNRIEKTLDFLNKQ
jgi:phage-related holin